MAKYLTEFNTYADYSGATLSLPNVSLIKSTGKVYYKNIYAGAVLGDILMWDVANQKLVATVGANWDVTTYPIASYEPIAINVYPAGQTPDGKGRWMSLKWVDNTSATGNTSSVILMWGNNGTGITSSDQDAFNGRANTDSALLLADGTTGNTQAAFPIFRAANIFYTNGTNAGDWYVPSYKELSLYQANYSTINTQITAIKTASSSIVDTVNTNMWSSTDGGYVYPNNSYRLTNNGTWYSIARNNSNNCSRAMLSL